MSGWRSTVDVGRRWRPAAILQLESTGDCFRVGSGVERGSLASTALTAGRWNAATARRATAAVLRIEPRESSAVCRLLTATSAGFVGLQNRFTSYASTRSLTTTKKNSWAIIKQCHIPNVQLWCMKNLSDLSFSLAHSVWSGSCNMNVKTTARPYPKSFNSFRNERSFWRTRQEYKNRLKKVHNRFQVSNRSDRLMCTTMKICKPATRAGLSR
jgi:hypothetical protein